jgi:hypothetical protein
MKAHEDLLCCFGGDVCRGIVEKHDNVAQLSLHLGVDLHVISPSNFPLCPG